jgi:hypothetical protein
MGLNLVCSACRFLSETTIRLKSWFSGLSIENFDCLSEIRKVEWINDALKYQCSCQYEILLKLTFTLNDSCFFFSLFVVLSV